MRPIDADKLAIDMEEKVFCGDGVIKIFGVSMPQIDAAPTIAPPPNDPLTLEQLLEMDGKPVWICVPDGSYGAWALVDFEYELCRTAKGGLAIFDTYRKTWLAYCRKPEEGTT